MMKKLIPVCILPVPFLYLLALASCTPIQRTGQSTGQSNGGTTPTPEATSTAATAPISSTSVMTGDWPSYNNTLRSERYSTLNQITTENVGNLTNNCTLSLGETANFQTGPLVINGVMYLTSNQSTYAVDAVNCILLWHHRYEDYTPDPEGLQVNRGAAYADGRLFRGVDNGYLYAHDASTGEVLWRTKVGDQQAGETFPAAPIAWNGLVFIGNAGGDNVGVRGRMMAFNAEDGQQVWSFDLVPLSGPGADTWPASTAENPRTGGATWTSYTIDPEAGLLYVPVGNAAPDYDIAARPGLNLYTDSIVILDAKTGELQSYYQITKNDFHDWDVAAAPSIITTVGGKQLAAAPGKDGILHGIDLGAKEVIYETPLTTISNTTTPFTAETTHFCPGNQGGVEWNGPAWDPQLNTLFVGAVDICASVTITPLQPAGEPGSPYTNSADQQAPFGTLDPHSTWRGWLTAVDADSGEVKWQYEADTPLVAGVTATAGGVVFTGDLNGRFMAFNAETGEQLFIDETGQPIAGGVVTYDVGGTQYVAVAVGMNSQIWQTEGKAQVIVYALQ
ncbi:MAG: PQQ-binding-like beta-propeller repeat protein [Caldilineaceae bacterium]